MNQKSVFKNIFLVIVVILTILPALVTFNSLLTSVFNSMHWYIWLQTTIVPYESRLVAVLLKLVGITSVLTIGQGDFSMLVKKSDQYLPVALQWNCLGWQSILLLIVTFITGLRNNYTFFSRIETIMLGILGTFLINIIRMALIISVGYYWNKLAVFIIHDYFAVLVALIWMIFFWWFSYSYVLEEKMPSEKENL